MIGIGKVIPIYERKMEMRSLGLHHLLDPGLGRAGVLLGFVMAMDIVLGRMLRYPLPFLLVPADGKRRLVIYGASSSSSSGSYHDLSLEARAMRRTERRAKSPLSLATSEDEDGEEDEENVDIVENNRYPLTFTAVRTHSGTRDSPFSVSSTESPIPVDIEPLAYPSDDGEEMEV